MSRTPAKVTQADVASVVYVVRIGKHIKIGVSRNIKARLKSFLTTSADVEPLLTIPGDRSLERQLHELLAEARIARELFNRDWRVQGFIDNVNYGGLERGLLWLDETTPRRRAERKKVEREDRVRVARLSKAEQDAYYASLVAQRKRETGW